MKRSHVLKIGATVVVLAAGLFLIDDSQPELKVAETIPAEPAVIVAKPLPQAISVKHISRAAVSDATSLQKLGHAWNQQMSEPVAAEFSDWSRKYLAASPSERSALENEGVMLADERQKFLTKLIQENPERALELSVPFSVRRELPASVQNLLETRISGRGILAVMGALAEPGKEHLVKPTFRTAKIGGKEYEAFAYGRRLGEPTQTDIPLNGIAIGNLLAVNENPVRVLEAAEVEEIAKSDEAICSVSGELTTVNEDETVVEVGDEIVFLCGIAHANVLNNKIIAESSVSPSIYTEGQKNLILIRVDFPDLPGEPFADATGTALISGLNTFYRDCSYNRASFALKGQGSDFTPTFRMPNNSSYYTTGTRYDDLRAHARAAAASFGYVLSDYTFDLICMGPVEGFNWSGLAYVGSASKATSGAWIRNSFGSAGVSAHELGHNYGLNHANFWDTGGQSGIGTNGTNVEYGDNLDTMGQATGSNNHFNARYKRFLNWLKANEVITVSNSGTYRIFCHDDINATGLRALSVAQTGTATNYWVEFRQKFTSNKWLMNGVSIRWAHTNLSNNDHTLLLDTTPNSHTSATTDKNDGALVIGRTLSDKKAGVHITPIGKGGTTPESIDIVVNKGTFPANVPPTISIAASATSVSSGATVNFTSNTSDPNGDALAYFWDFGDTDFGTNGPTASKSWSTGEYVVRCTVTDMKGGVASDSVIIRVGSPTTFRISGRVMTNNTPVEGVRVFVPSSNRLTYTDSDGTYNLVGLPGGSYTLNAQLDGYTFTNVTFANPISVGPNATGKDFNTSITAPPTITSQPQSRFVATGSNVVFNVAATAKTGSLSYTWRFNGNNIANATNSSVTIFNAQLTNAGNYSVVVSGPTSSVTSSNAVLSVNAPPVLSPVSNQAVVENTLLTLNASASDVQTVSYNLAPGAPAGATIHSMSGVFNWTPSEGQGPGTYQITIVATDNGTPQLSDSKTFTANVTEANRAPSLVSISNQFVNAGETLTLTNLASDSDFPANILSFSLTPNTIEGAALDSSSGIFTWTAPTATKLLTNTVNVVVSDNGDPSLSDTKSFAIIVIPPPQLSSMDAPSNGSLTLTWQTFPGKIYQMQYKNNFEEPEWKNFEEPVVAMETTLSITDNAPAPAQRFYRLLQID